MKENNMEDLHWQLNQMSSRELEDMLNAETGKEVPDDDIVLSILFILDDRNAGKPVELTPQEEKIWEEYQERINSRVKKPVRLWKRVLKVASMVLVVGGFIALIPLQTHAGNFWKVLTRADDEIFEYVNIDATEEEPEEYVFESDDPGLQQVYDAVASELGETEPVVVQKILEGFELGEIIIVDTPAEKGVHANFIKGEEEIILLFDKMKLDFSPEYNKDAKKISQYEYKGVMHNITYNNDILIASWVKNNLKCSIIVDCEEDTLKEMIMSIY